MSNKDILIRLFHKLDVSGDGVLSRDELFEGLRRAGVSPTTLQKLMDRLDLNADGIVTLSEYKTAIGVNNNE
ncbi:16 kDa calcium-binding protein [Schistosoma japonicum]|nr:16 kDa calcium-binding protein [Schistosoma japonicum]KAH8867081.1 16 kDa calcium-binding protein [Schistosoma japonicum]KAH8867082.1 16 kDa calcium-binding protein [Schistosoma japonicum]KAH8867083.1 16 kDa calcium-binding protein [Schistosoma japonicum]